MATLHLRSKQDTGTKGRLNAKRTAGYIDSIKS